MKVIRPVNITSGALVSSNVPEDDYPEWTPGTYNQGDRRIIEAEHKIYEVVAETTTDSPIDGIVADPPTWIDLGATNRWRMFDDKVGTQTTNPDSVSVTIAPNAVVNSLALFELAGDSVTVVMTDPTEGVVYDRTVSLVDNSSVVDWYSYFFNPVERRSDMVLFDLPAYATATLTITVSQPNGTAAVGMLSIGYQLDIGRSLYGASFGIIDYSRKEIDEFGNATILRRAFRKRASVQVSVETNRFDYIHRELSDLRATPVVWAAADNFQSSILFGFFRDFDMILAGPNVSDCLLDIEGLI